MYEEDLRAHCLILMKPRQAYRKMIGSSMQNQHTQFQTKILQAISLDSDSQARYTEAALVLRL